MRYPWQSEAACHQHPDPDLWFPEDGTGDTNGHTAKTICAGCPVRLECLVTSLANGETVGIWGGAGGKDRRPLRKAFRAAAHDPLGVDEACGCAWCTTVTAWFAGEVLDANGPGATHGLRATQAKGCRCAACTWAASAEGQLLARHEVDTADWWRRHDGSGTIGDLYAALIGTSVVVVLHPVKPDEGGSIAKVNAPTDRTDLVNRYGLADSA